MSQTINCLFRDPIFYSTHYLPGHFELFIKGFQIGDSFFFSFFLVRLIRALLENFFRKLGNIEKSK